ncbi:ATP-binding protein [Acinetobacter baumannii]
MKLHTEHENLIGNTSNMSSFGIAASAKAFQILSSGIYKHKILAVVRETVCNAYDAHKMVNSNEKWQVKAPTELDPRFVVRDFGPGLSEDNILDIYTQYFVSTKNEDGEQIGGFGLGAKSPFSYTDTFTVTSYHNEMVRIYTAALKNGEPVLIKVYEGEFEEGDRTGIEVTVPVKSDDIQKFNHEIRHVLKVFDPNSFELIGIDMDPNMFLKNHQNYSDDWFFTASNSYTNSPGIYAICGNIIYPLQGTPGLETSWLLAKGGVVYVHFSINELMPQPSREQLQMDDFTVSNIVKRVNLINKNELEKDIAELNEIKYERKLIRTLNELPGSQYNALIQMGKTFLGKTIDKLGTGYNTKGLVKGLNRIRIYEVCESPRIKRIADDTSAWRKTKVSEVKVSSLVNWKKDEIFFLIDDTKGKKVRESLKAFSLFPDAQLYPKRWENVLVIRQEDPVEMELIELFKEIYKGDKVTILYNSELTNLHEKLKSLKSKEVKPKEAKPTSPNAHLSTIDPKTGNYVHQDLYLTSAEISELDGFCLGTYNQDPTMLSDNFSHISLNMTSVISLAKRLGIREFIRVRPSIYKRVLKNPNLKCLINELQQRVIDVSSDPSNSELCYYNSSYRFASNICNNKILRPLYSRFSGEYSQKSMEFINIMNAAKGILGGKSDLNEKFNLVIDEFKKNMDIAETKYHEEFAKFKDEHPTVTYVLVDSYGIGDHIAKDIVKILDL